MHTWIQRRRANASDVRSFAQAAACLLAAAWLGACSPASEPKTATAPTPAAPPPPEDVLSQGGAIYDQICATCHGNGKSATGKAPVLQGGAVLADPANVINGILHGRKSGFLVNGLPIGMPPQNGLSDEDIAAVVTFVRHEFGNINQLTTPQDVAKMRDDQAR